MVNALQIQLMLRSVGYTPGTSGTLDSQTQRSIRVFQGDMKLPPTGEMDWDTLQKLKRCHVHTRQSQA